jgi:hypothetical protein
MGLAAANTSWKRYTSIGGVTEMAFQPAELQEITVG